MLSKVRGMSKEKRGRSSSFGVFGKGDDEGFKTKQLRLQGSTPVVDQNLLLQSIVMSQNPKARNTGSSSTNITGSWRLRTPRTSSSLPSDFVELRRPFKIETFSAWVFTGYRHFGLYGSLRGAQSWALLA